MNVNDYLAKAYPSPPCWALVADVYASELAQPVTQWRAVNGSVRALASAFAVAVQKNPDGFAQLDAPEEMCLVLLGKLRSTGVHHCGVYVEGRVLHALETGPVHEGLTTLGDVYEVIEFWGLQS